MSEKTPTYRINNEHNTPETPKKRSFRSELFDTAITGFLGGFFDTYIPPESLASDSDKRMTADRREADSSPEDDK